MPLLYDAEADYRLRWWRSWRESRSGLVSKDDYIRGMGWMRPVNIIFQGNNFQQIPGFLGANYYDYQDYQDYQLISEIKTN